MVVLACLDYIHPIEHMCYRTPVEGGGERGQETKSYISKHFHFEYFFFNIYASDP